MDQPYIIEFGGASSGQGSLSFVENSNIPFEIKRVYWIYDVKKGDIRGGHAHKTGGRVLICTSGAAKVVFTNRGVRKYHFQLADPSKGVYFPEQHWIDIEFLEPSVLVALASCAYQDDEYITDYQQFLSESS